MKKEIKRFTIDESMGFAYVDLVHSSGFDSSDFTKRVIGSCCGKGRHFLFPSRCEDGKNSH
ncbi:hypothetical protein BsIDN1_64560 [Bacillus safensis]|uniref:Uncharacterized protein n=1 Tax=Bacillus safensis TaxID=561879 RepID=A0A5S9MIB3_BACIA|nr:hypothetical protein BsIDN1_64560 [Bacillus safensis]